MARGLGGILKVFQRLRSVSHMKTVLNQPSATVSERTSIARSLAVSLNGRVFAKQRWSGRFVNVAPSMCSALGPPLSLLALSHFIDCIQLADDDCVRRQLKIAVGYYYILLCTPRGGHNHSPTFTCSCYLVGNDHQVATFDPLKIILEDTDNKHVVNMCTMSRILQSVISLFYMPKVILILQYLEPDYYFSDSNTKVDLFWIQRKS